MKSIAVLAAVAAFSLALTASAAVQAQGSSPQAGSSDAEPLVRQGVRQRAPQARQRVRTRILVQPRYYPRRNFHSVYPLPYDVEYPGPRARRDCAVRYVQEFRPSGTVVVPRMRCWWVRG